MLGPLWNEVYQLIGLTACSVTVSIVLMATKTLERVSTHLNDIQYGERTHRHWHYVYRRRRKKIESISSREIMAGQIIALMGSLVAGFLLELNKEHIVLFTGALLLLPGIIDLSASITGAMCAKINHRLDSDVVRRVMTHSIGFSFLLTLFSGLIVGVFAGAVAELFFDAIFWKILVLCVSSLMIVGCVTYPLMAVLTFLLKKRGFDPDNIVGPVETGVSDALMVLTVSIIVRAFI